MVEWWFFYKIIDLLKVSEISIMDRYSTGSTISKHDITDAFKMVDLLTKDSSKRNIMSII